ncbi:MAG: Ig-like domain-containing protein [Bacteroidetes bacterium]|nr:Ig-like domain-containing protein [Bacteroidota bacterium]MCL1968582.1 Ig-like domain-containing protein [Bacteroidota bacterium]
MNKLSLFARTISIVLLLFIAFSCEDPIPHITITSPQNNQEYFKDENIDVKVILTDTKDKAFPVQLYVDDKFFGELPKAPYYFTVKAGEVLPGKHTIKISTTGSDALRMINIKEAKSESDDFVTFTDGIIPPEWSAVGWIINNFSGFDDKYSLTTITSHSQVSTTKRCNKVSFYMRGSGYIELHMDGKLLEPIQMRAGGSHNSEQQEWTLYEYSFLTGYHTFTWTSVTVSKPVSLDAICFEKLKNE